ncbi:hypothetical protein METSCH_A08030 [Metschnikowia aff. pulcherrima]|uniref:Vacuolar ATPase assembly protein VMA22 n=1 Tax=Metschnikowia aff. pulcherrima TaxID=2163413 RepID=A0A4P6XFP8_9ASCO|nr:hypothetical protein METSCH_A08030 [Metschnikowia aff. pulcherrima]
MPQNPGHTKAERLSLSTESIADKLQKLTVDSDASGILANDLEKGNDLTDDEKNDKVETPKGASSEPTAKVHGKLEVEDENNIKISQKEEFLHDSVDFGPDSGILGEDKNGTGFSVEDEKTFKLLQLLDEYEILANESLSKTFTQGFLDLSRANYHGSQRYNMDSIDMRPRDATTVVEKNTGKFIIRDEWQIYKQNRDKLEKVDKETKLEKCDDETVQSIASSGQNSKTETEPITKSENASEENTGASSSALATNEVRNRKQKLATSKNSAEDVPFVENETSESQSGKPPQDPVHQFGRLVPYQLRNAQKHFLDALAESVKLLNLQEEILELVSELLPNGMD